MSKRGKRRRKSRPARRIVALCPHCWHNRVLTRHHVLPKRWFGDSHLILLLCRESHDLIELQIHEEERLHGGVLPKQRYAEIAMNFIRGTNKKRRIGFNGGNRRRKR